MVMVPSAMQVPPPSRSSSVPSLIDRNPRSLTRLCNQAEKVWKGEKQKVMMHDKFYLEQRAMKKVLAARKSDPKAYYEDVDFPAAMQSIYRHPTEPFEGAPLALLCAVPRIPKLS